MTTIVEINDGENETIAIEIRLTPAQSKHLISFICDGVTL
jgi:hypothetical protein